jgi:hypothetical protein
MKYRKKPVVIEAEQFSGENNPFGVIEHHQCTYRMCPLCGGDDEPHAYIKTLEGGHIVTEGDFVIKGIMGEFYPCKPDIFEKTYEKA